MYKSFSAYYAHSSTGPDKIIGSGKGLPHEDRYKLPSVFACLTLFTFGSQRYLISYPRRVRVIKGDCTPMIAAHSFLYPASHTWCYLIYPLFAPVSICGLMKLDGNLAWFLLKSEMGEFRN